MRPLGAYMIQDVKWAPWHRNTGDDYAVGDVPEDVEYKGEEVRRAGGRWGERVKKKQGGRRREESWNGGRRGTGESGKE